MDLRITKDKGGLVVREEPMADISSRKDFKVGDYFTKEETVNQGEGHKGKSGHSCLRLCNFWNWF